MSKNLDYYRGLPYSLKVERFVEDEDGEEYYRAFYEEIPQVKGIHEDRLLAIKLAKELFDSYIEVQLEWGEEIPEPASTRSRKQGGLFRFKAVDFRSSGTEAPARRTDQQAPDRTSASAEDNVQVLQGV